MDFQYFEGDEDVSDPGGRSLFLTIPDGGYPVSDSVSTVSVPIHPDGKADI